MLGGAGILFNLIHPKAKQNNPKTPHLSSSDSLSSPRCWLNGEHYEVLEEGRATGWKEPGSFHDY